MKKMYYLIILLVLVFPLNIKATRTFIKMDEEGNYIENAEFIIRSVNGNVTYPVKKGGFDMSKSPTPISTIRLNEEENSGDGIYAIHNNTGEEYDRVLSILGPEERKIVEDLKDKNKHDEYRQLFNQTFSSEYEKLQVTRGISFNIESCTAFSPSPGNIDTIGDGECREKVSIVVPVLMVLEETKAPSGLKKTKAIVEHQYYIDYYYTSPEENTIESMGIYYYVKSIYKYNHDLDYSNVIALYTKKSMLTNEDELYYKNECGNYFYEYSDFDRTPTPMSSKKMIQSHCNEAVPVIIDYKSGAVLTISSYVNNGGSTKAVKGSQVNYKVVVKNEGTEGATNNVITSRIPYGFEYVDGSASDGGEYIESVNAVRWNVDVINAESTKELTYKVSVSEDVDLSQSYVSSATISNDSSDEIESNETVVTLQGEIENPKTGDFNKIIVLFVLSVIGLITYYFIDRKTIKGL